MKKIFIFMMFSFSWLFAFEELTLENFDSKIKGKNAIVDVYAVWCPPCKVLANNLEDFDVVKPDDVEVFKVNFDENSQLAKKYNVSKLPTLLYFKDGKLVDEKVGVLSVEKLKKSVETNFR